MTTVVLGVGPASAQHLQMTMTCVDMIAAVASILPFASLPSVVHRLTNPTLLSCPLHHKHGIKKIHATQHSRVTSAVVGRFFQKSSTVGQDSTIPPRSPNVLLTHQLLCDKMENYIESRILLTFYYFELTILDKMLCVSNALPFVLTPTASLSYRDPTNCRWRLCGAGTVFE